MDQQADPAWDTAATERVDPGAHRSGEDEREEEQRDHELQLPQCERGGDDAADDERGDRGALGGFDHLLRNSPRHGESCNPVVTSAHEQVCLEERRHGVVLVAPFVRALLLAAPGALAVAVGWPATVVGAALLAAAALLVLRAVWRWERTRVVLTTEKLFVVDGTWRRRAAAVRLSRVGPIEIEQSVLGRLLGYGTIVAGELEITHVPQPRRLVERLGG